MGGPGGERADLGVWGPGDHDVAGFQRLHTGARGTRQSLSSRPVHPPRLERVRIRL